MTQNPSCDLPPPSEKKDEPKPKIKKRKLIPGHVREAQRLERNKARTRAWHRDASPEDMDDIRREVSRHLARYIGNVKQRWRTCAEPRCRRTRACCSPELRCSNAPPPAPTTPERRARTMALVQRVMRELSEQQEAAGESAPSLHAEKQENRSSPRENAERVLRHKRGPSPLKRTGFPLARE